MLLDFKIGFACIREIGAQEYCYMIAFEFIKEGKYAKQLQLAKFCTDFFLGFPSGRLFERFVPFHTTANEVPTIQISWLHQQNLPIFDQQ